jgi:hypothetical protein
MFHDTMYPVAMAAVAGAETVNWPALLLHETDQPPALLLVATVVPLRSTCHCADWPDEEPEEPNDELGPPAVTCGFAIAADPDRIAINESSAVTRTGKANRRKRPVRLTLVNDDGMRKSTFRPTLSSLPVMAATDIY